MLSFQGKNGEREREERIYFCLVGATFCVSAAEVNNPRTPSCASRHLERRENYFITGKGNRSRPTKIQIYRKRAEEEKARREKEDAPVALKEA